MADISAEESISKKPYDLGGEVRAAWLVALIAFLLVCVDVQLIRMALAGSSFGTCGGGCDEVLDSGYSRVFGLPLGVFGMGAHLLLAAAYFGRRKQAWRRVLPWAAGGILGAGVFLAVIQAAVIGKFCMWCNTAHLMGGALAVLLAWRLHFRPRHWLQSLASAAMAVLSIALFHGGKSQSPPSVTIIAEGRAVEASSNKLSLHGGRFELDMAELPHAGVLVDRPVVVAFTDYTCPHCRRVEGVLGSLLEESPGQFGVVWLPAYRNDVGAKVQSMLFALYGLDSKAYETISKSLWEGSLPVTEELVKAEILKFTGGDFARVESRLPWAETMLAKTKEILLANKEKVSTADLPQMIIKDKIMVGDGGETGRLAVMLREELGLTSAQLPVLLLAAREMELGTVRGGDVQEVSVKFKNTGTSTLKVEGFQELINQRVVLGQQGSWQPGQTGEVRVQVPVPKANGPFSVPMQLLSNAEKQVFTVTGTAATLWTLSESKLDFGRWEAGAPIPAAKTVRLTFDEPATIASPQVGAYDFTGTSAVVEAQRSFDVSISPSVDLPPGHHEITVNVPVRPGVDLKTGAELPMPPGVPSVIHIPLSITRL